MIRNYDATRAYDKIKGSSAFNVPGYTSRKKINQHCTLYTFPDHSRMMINHTKSRADCWHPDWKGTANDIHLGPIKGAALSINQRGV